MDVQCVLCDIETSIENNTYAARRLYTNRNHAFLCQSCYERIKINTENRLNTGKFQFRKGHK